MQPRVNTHPPEPSSATDKGSPLALGGLFYGLGVLDAEEVLRYLDATFRARAEKAEKSRGEHTR